MDFQKLYKEEKNTEKQGGQQEFPVGPGAAIALFRFPVAAGMLIAGFFLFSLQMLSGSDIATPQTIYALVLVEDRSSMVAESPEEQVSGADQGEEGTKKQPPQTFSHYEGRPQEGFSERFSEFAAAFKAPSGISVVQVNLLRVLSSSVVDAGTESAATGSFGDPAYRQLTLSPEDAAFFLGRDTDISLETGEQYFLSPFPYRKSDKNQELILQDNERVLLERLPEKATAMQPLIVHLSQAVEANALLLLPLTDVSVGDFASAVNSATKNLGSKNDLIALMDFSDYRHGTLVYALAVIGEALFMIGGFLLFYHLFVRIARRKRQEKALIANAFSDACVLVVNNYHIYTLSIGLFMLFWLWGMITAALDPGYQNTMLQWYRGQFAGGTWPLGVAGQAFASSNIILAIIITFIVNFVQGTVLTLSLYSIIPLGSAFILNAIRGQVLGMALAPTNMFFGQTMALHLPTILIELQGYLLAGFVSVLLPLALIYPDRFGCTTRFEAFKKYLLWQFRILPLVAVILFVAAVYEAIELILLFRLL